MMGLSLEVIVLFLLALLIVGSPFWWTLVLAAMKGRDAILGVWLVETVLIITLFWRQGFDAWNNQDVFNEPGEWMTIQITQSLAVCIWLIASVYSLIKLRTLKM